MSARKRIGFLTGILFLVSGNSLAADRGGAPKALGIIIARGDVSVDGQPAHPGAVLFPGSTVATGKGSVAAIKLSSGFSATLAENGEAVLSPDSATALKLRKGAVVVRNEAPMPRQINVNGAKVVLEGQPGSPAVSSIALVGGGGIVSTERGRVEMRGRGPTIVVPPGKSARWEAGAPQASGQRAGQVSHAIPDEVVQRLGKGPEIQLAINDPVHWEDLVRTMRAGRVRIAMDDGSVLNIGARSVMRIVRHDAQTQQTEVELQLGRLRGEVAKITKPGGSFQVRTQTAVMGVVGSIFSMIAMRNNTRITCIEGQLHVRNVNPAVGGEVTLNPGQSTNVPRGQPPGGAASANTSQILSEVSQTAAGETFSSNLSQALQSLGATPADVARAAAQVPTTAGARAGAVAGARAGSTAAKAAATGGSIASAAVSGAAIPRLGTASDDLESTDSILGKAANDAAAASSAAADAVATSSQVADGVQDLINFISVTQPGCGCR